MGPLKDLLAVDDRKTLEFFFVGLKDVSETDVDQRELLYNASVLAHYTQVSTQADVDLGAPATLGAVFDHFVADTTLMHDGLMMEMADAQCLLLAGFFEHQMRRRHNIRWYAELGAGFFNRAAAEEPSAPKARLLVAIATHFETWRRRHAQFSRQLRDERTSNAVVALDLLRGQSGNVTGTRRGERRRGDDECRSNQSNLHHKNPFTFAR